MSIGSTRKRYWILAAVLGVPLATAAYFLVRHAPASGPDLAAGPGASVARESDPGREVGPLADESRPAGGAQAAESSSGEEPSAIARGPEERAEKPPVPVSAQPVGFGPISAYISSTANLVPESEVKVLAEVEGRVEEFRVEEGQRVARGQVLATLVRDEAEMALRKAELKATHARLTYERGIKAAPDKLLSEEEFQKRKTDKEVAEQELEEARWQLAKRTIRAPFAGRVTERNVQPGLHVKPGEPLFTVADFDPLIARIHLPERDILGLAEGRDVRITLKAAEATRFRGRIRQISPVVDTGTGTVKVTVEATDPPAEVRPGAFVTIDVVRETRPWALLVPRQAVISELQDSYVFVARNGQAERRRVRLGLEEAGRVEVLSGVAAGEQVIVGGQGSVKEGTRVQVVPEAGASRRGPDSRRLDDSRDTRG